ncbi:MCE family protein [Acetobacteraceae bacterium]|nr:MCE family protein [Acetobacteraceae bacterium]
MISKNNGQIFLSALVLLATLLFFSWCWGIKHSSLEKYVSYSATFSSVDGLQVGAPIFSRGIEVGTVKSIHLNSDQDNASVAFLLKKGLLLPKDSSLILSKSMMGGSSLELIPGKSQVFLSYGDSLLKTISQPSLEQKISNYAFGGSVQN